MAAMDTFEQFNKKLAGRSVALFESLTKSTTLELLAARSEDARNRIVEDYIRQIHHLSTKDE